MMSMKHKLLILLVISIFSSLAFAEKAVELKTDKQKVSYIVGTQIGQQLKGDGMDVDADMLGQAIRDVMKGTAPRLSPEEMQAVMTKYQQERMAKMNEKGAKNLEAGKAFLAANKKKEGITELANGLQYKVIKGGSGKKPSETDTVTVNYRGTLIDGAEFDSSYKRGEPANFPVNRVIPGWTQVLQLMAEGSKWQVFIPSELAYGKTGSGATIGPNSTLIFDIELIKVN
jgi:FKBP-type peptidyl-prolyl cis-trans isomerase FklB